MKDTEDNDEERYQLQTLGELSRSICHDLKNYLTAVQGNAQMTLQAKSPDDIEHCMGGIMQATRVARDLCDQVLTYAHKGTVPLEPLDLGQLAGDTIEVLQNSIAENIQISLEIPEQPVCVQGNRSQIRQVLTNLVINSTQAIGSDEGKILLKVLANHEHESVYIDVEDNGPGIPNELVSEVFKTGYTTKRHGGGHGLGLVLVKRIVESHKGEIVLANNAKGACKFRVTLPLSETCPNELTTDATPDEPTTQKKRNILLVDDEEFMLNLGMDILQTLNYRVTVANCAKDALDLLDKNPDYFDVILSDSQMPEMNGEAFALAVEKRKPGLPFILVTAYASANVTYDTPKKGIYALVAKPFLIEDLKQALNHVLG